MTKQKEKKQIGSGTDRNFQSYQDIIGSYSKKKVLIIAPHADDEIFWCYSLLKGSTVIVLGGRTEDAKNISRKLANEIGYTLILANFKDREYYNSFNEIRELIEKEVKIVKPEEIYYPAITHHQDHNTVNEIMNIIARPMRFPFLKKIVEYPYWDMKEFKFNSMRKVSEAKFKYVKRFNEPQWIRYIESYNKYIANKFDMEGHYETFDIKFLNETGE